MSVHIKTKEESDIVNLTIKQEEDVALIMMMSTINMLSTMWIANTAASTHINNEEMGL